MFFRQSKFEANWEKNGSRGSGGILSQKFFEILLNAMAFLVLLNKFWSNFCPSFEALHQMWCILFAHFRFMRAYFRPGTDPENFGGEMQFWIWLNVYYCECKNGRGLDTEKILNRPKLFDNFSCLRRNQKFFEEKGSKFQHLFKRSFFRQN